MSTLHRLQEHRLNRRLAPRPLPLHLASAMGLWLSSRGALANWSAAWPSSRPLADRLHALAEEIEATGRAETSAAFDRHIRTRAETFLRGVEAYRAHSYRRPPTRRPVLWRDGTTRLLDYGRGRGGAPVLVIPSLINRYYVLDLQPEHSFLRCLSTRGLRPVLVDWGVPGEAEQRFTIADYVGRLDAALGAVRQAVGGPAAVLGYCMGGLLALALALRRPAETARLVLLATPWDFHAENPAQAELLATAIELMLSGSDPDPLAVEAIQGLFWALDPFLAERKFVRFAGLDPESAEARAFVALEDWINDGVPLARAVARECGAGWYRENTPAAGEWRVAGRSIEPAALAVPSLVVLPSRDHIVPPRSAEALATALPGPTVMRPEFGHIGMMASAAAPETVWRPIADWLGRQGG